MSGGEHVWRLSCPDRPGIVAAVSTLLAEAGCNIEQSQQYGDPDTRTFFLRVQFSAAEGLGLEDLRERVRPVVADFSMASEIVDAAVRPKVLILVSSVGHCLNDLLFRASTGALPVDVVGIVSNHTTFERLADNYGVPFHHVPVTRDTKARAEARLWGLVEEHDVDLVVLARYMQVLGDELCRRLEGRAINIHHSMLPSFKGAKPYHQAHDRGVKLVGATAHYVTAVLDEGPIIEQEVARVDHAMTPAQLVAAGRDVECQALARAVRWHAEGRVLLNGQRTVVLR